VEFSFPHSGADNVVKNIVASAKKASIAGEERIVFTFSHAPVQEVLVTTGEDAGSWKSCLDLTYEPYMEFRLVMPVRDFDGQDDRTAYLRQLGDNLKVKFANGAAVKLYRGEENGGLAGDSFISFFNNQNDALRFLDMLSIVGQIKAETLVNAHNRIAQVEMRCQVRFGKDEDSIAALYCAQRDLTGYQRYAAIIGSSRVEMNFVFNQPFTGFAFLAPPRPIERPGADNVDSQLDEILNRIHILRANDAITEIYQMDKAQFMMKPMRVLFTAQETARQVMKELFVMRITSVERYSEARDVLERVSTYQATFDSADRLTGVLVATSKYHYGYKARHSNKKEGALEEPPKEKVLSRKGKT
jgi:hypothetical protein